MGREFLGALVTLLLLLVWAVLAYLSGRQYARASGPKRTMWRFVLIGWFCLPPGWVSLFYGTQDWAWLVVALLLFTIAAIAFVTAFVAPLFAPPKREGQP